MKIRNYKLWQAFYMGAAFFGVIAVFGFILMEEKNMAAFLLSLFGLGVVVVYLLNQWKTKKRIKRFEKETKEIIQNKIFAYKKGEGVGYFGETKNKLIFMPFKVGNAVYIFDKKEIDICDVVLKESKEREVVFINGDITVLDEQKEYELTIKQKETTYLFEIIEWEKVKDWV